MKQCPKCGYKPPKHPNRGQFVKTIARGAGNLKYGVKNAFKKPEKHYKIMVYEDGTVDLIGNVPVTILKKLKSHLNTVETI